MKESTSQSHIVQLAERQLADYDAGTPGMMFADGVTLSEEAAYAVQEQVTCLRERRGEAVIGYKVGCTSKVIQQQFGIDHPMYGRLFASGCHLSGVRLSSASYDNLAIEGELAVRLADDVSGPQMSDEVVREKIKAVFPVIELHNHVFRGAVPSASELIANNGLHAGFVMPTQLRDNCQTVEPKLTILLNGKVEEACGSVELKAGLVSSIRWLAAVLASAGTPLKAGQTILTGSQARLISVNPGTCIVVESSDCGSVDAAILA